MHLAPASLVMPLGTYLARRRKTKPAARVVPQVARQVEKPGAKADARNALAASLLRAKAKRVRSY